MIRDIRGDPDPHTKTHFVPLVFDSRSEWEQRQSRVQRQILAAAGLFPMPRRGPVRARPFGTLTRERYVVEKLLIETLPGFFVGANLYRPAQAVSEPRRRPAVLVPHGHWKHGRVEHTAAYSVPALCANLAARGYVSLSYDMVGYNDTRQLPHHFGGSAQEQSWAFGPLAIQLWNSIRMLDYLSSRDDVDPARLAVTGASGGGTQT